MLGRRAGAHPSPTLRLDTMLKKNFMTRKYITSCLPHTQEQPKFVLKAARYLNCRTIINL